MDKIAPNLPGARGTALLTLYARALDNQTKEPILGDEGSEEVLAQLDFDWRTFKSAKNQRFNVGIRTKQLDDWVRKFVQQHPDGLVLDLGCGLDRRYFRVAPPPTVDWYDIDFPDVIDLRAKFYTADANYHAVPASLTDAEWLQQIPADRPAIAVADGVLPFLADDDVKQLLVRVVNHFPSGQIAFNQYTGLMAALGRRHPAVKSTGAAMNKGIDDARSLESWHPRLRLVEEAPLVTSPYISTMSWAQRATCRAMAAIPSLRRYGQLVRYEF
jgi:O-methyltransferase involved in polyketide biosynthesis